MLYFDMLKKTHQALGIETHPIYGKKRRKSYPVIYYNKKVSQIKILKTPQTDYSRMKSVNKTG